LDEGMLNGSKRVTDANGRSLAQRTRLPDQRLDELPLEQSKASFVLGATQNLEKKPVRGGDRPPNKPSSGWKGGAPKTFRILTRGCNENDGVTKWGACRTAQNLEERTIGEKGRNRQ